MLVEKSVETKQILELGVKTSISDYNKEASEFQLESSLENVNEHVHSTENENGDSDLLLMFGEDPITAYEKDSSLESTEMIHESEIQFKDTNKSKDLHTITLEIERVELSATENERCSFFTENSMESPNSLESMYTTDIYDSDEIEMGDEFAPHKSNEPDKQELGSAKDLKLESLNPEKVKGRLKSRKREEVTRATRNKDQPFLCSKCCKLFHNLCSCPKFPVPQNTTSFGVIVK